MTLALVLGLASAGLWGVSDLLARIAGRRLGPLRILVYGHGCMALATSLCVLVLRAPQASLAAYAAAFGSNLVLLGATAAFYLALSRGRITLVSPLVAGYGAVTAVLAWGCGEPVRPLGAAAVLMIVAGGVFVASGEDLEEPKGAGGAVSVAAALLAALGYGVGFFLQGRFVVPALGVFTPVWLYYVQGAGASLLFAALTRSDLRVPSFGIGAGLCATTAFAAAGTLALTFGEATGRLALVTALSGLGCAVAVALAWLFLHERASVRGLAGLLVTLAGIGLLRLG